MSVGSLLDLGLLLEDLSAELSKLRLKNYKLSARRLVKSQIGATKFDVETTHEQLTAVMRISQRSSMRSNSMEGSRIRRPIFYRLAEAEAKVHGSSINQVHFHEVGAVDAIVDIVAACIALEMLGIQRVYASALKRWQRPCGNRSWDAACSGASHSGALERSACVFQSSQWRTGYAHRGSYPDDNHSHLRAVASVSN